MINKIKKEVKYKGKYQQARASSVWAPGQASGLSLLSKVWMKQFVILIVWKLGDQDLTQADPKDSHINLQIPLPYRIPVSWAP